MRALYRILAIFNDVRAVRKGKAGKRLANRAIGRGVVSKLWRR